MKLKYKYSLHSCVKCKYLFKYAEDYCECFLKKYSGKITIYKYCPKKDIHETQSKLQK